MAARRRGPAFSARFVLRILAAPPGATTVETETFAIPTGFVGHVYVHGMGGDQQAIFAIGADGNGQITAVGGEVFTRFEHNLPQVQLRQRGTGELQVAGLTFLAGLPEFVRVAVVGVHLNDRP